SFLEMPPDPAVLAAWLEAHPPAGGEEFGVRVVRLFEALNAKLREELGPAAQVGHSYFMVPGLDEERRRLVLRHPGWTPLAEQHAGRPERLAALELEGLLDGPKIPAPRPRSVP